MKAAAGWGVLVSATTSRTLRTQGSHPRSKLPAAWVLSLYAGLCLPLQHSPASRLLDASHTPRSPQKLLGTPELLRVEPGGRWQDPPGSRSQGSCH